MKYKLYKGDCLEVMDKLIEEGVKVDAIICDPPYGKLNKTKTKWDNPIPYNKMWERLEKLGLEYGYCSLFLQGKIATKDELFEQLFIAIRQFSKRQQTWFRMMEKKGVKIHWLEPASKEERINQALQLISKESFD